MEKLYNNSQPLYVSIHINKYGRIYIPLSVFRIMSERIHSEFADIYASKKKLKIVPSEQGEFTIATNGGNQRGRVVTLNRQAIVKYSITGGHYPCSVEDDGTLTITLERSENDA